ncbi:hypothetical protein [Desulfogranum japonicum]|uniref:hypothetical protein n=1 Tax=Desulfogranum japonicum TaxID=231447 RepID=UPI00042963F7|nr:hypothetical protein [Desulfogranum japonicum]
MKQLYFILLGVLLFFCQTVHAEIVYEGKGNDIFAYQSSEVVHAEKLDAVVAAVEKIPLAKKVVVTVAVNLFVKQGIAKDDVPDVSTERCLVVVERLQKEMPSLAVECAGKTYPAFVPESTLEMLLQQQVPVLDLFKVAAITAGDETNDLAAEEIIPLEELEPWQQEMRKKYEAIVAKHTECEVDPPLKYCGIRCDPGRGKKSKEYGLCVMRAYRCELVSGRLQTLSVDIVEYDLKKLRVLQKTTPLVYNIALEIENFSGKRIEKIYNPALLQREIDSNVIALKYVKRVIEKSKMGTDHINNTKDDKCYGVTSFFKSWMKSDLCYGMFYQSWYRLVALEHVKNVHNFVRESIGLPKLKYEDEFPICMSFGDFYRSESGSPKDSSSFYNSCEKIYREIVSPGLVEYGYHELPLE